MKKLLLLPFFFIILVSCSADDTDMFVAEKNNNAYEAFNTKVNVPKSCLPDLTGYTIVNVENGFGNPVLEFYVYSAMGKKRQYMLSLEIETLVDCEDENGTGNVITYDCGTGNNFNNFKAYAISYPELPADCYRWRFVAQSLPGTLECMSETPWYDSALF